MYYFAYGMLTNIDSMKKHAKTAKCLGHASVAGYRFRFALHADIVPDETSVCHGVLWEIDSNAIASLDLLEDYPEYYNKINVDVMCHGIAYQAIAYIMQPSHNDEEPSEHYCNMVLGGYIANNVPCEQILNALLAIGPESKWQLD
jgi:gamma-glutamylcyclotransferase (GGCT)/AIG2-like uncharacterized protein YtfP